MSGKAEKRRVAQGEPREQGEGEKNIEKKGEQWGLTQWAEPEAAP